MFISQVKNQFSHIVKRKLTERIGFSSVALAAFITVLPIILVVGYVFLKGAPAISFDFLTEMPKDGMRAGGILPAIVGTFWLTLGTAIISVPLGLGAAIYLAEYAPENRWTRIIRIADAVWALCKTGKATIDKEDATLSGVYALEGCRSSYP